MNRRGAPGSRPATRQTDDYAGRDAGALRARGSPVRPLQAAAKTCDLSVINRDVTVERILQRNRRVFLYFVGGALLACALILLAIFAKTRL